MADDEVVPSDRGGKVVQKAGAADYEVRIPG
jgi:hypothetical protein